jgi:hypothetical protein
MFLSMQVVIEQRIDGFLRFWIEKPAAPVGVRASPRTGAVVMRADAYMVAAAVLIMDGPGRLVRARRNHNCADSG